MHHHHAAAETRCVEIQKQNCERGFTDGLKHDEVFCEALSQLFV